MAIEQLLILATIVRFLTEGVKRQVDHTAFSVGSRNFAVPERFRDEVLWGVSLALGVASVVILGDGANVFAQDFSNLDNTWGVLGTGAVVGAGSEAVEYGFDMLKAWRDVRRATATANAA